MKHLGVYLTIACFLCAGNWLFGQSDRMLFSEAMEQMKSSYKVDFSYDPDLINGIKIDVISKKKPLKKVLQELERNSAFRFRFINDSIITVVPKIVGRNLMIRGTINDHQGAPLPGAIIYIGSQNLNATTDPDGNFELMCLLNSSDSVSIKFIGFETKKYALQILNEVGFSSLNLLESNLAIDEVLVSIFTTSGVLYNYKDQDIEIKLQNAGLLPGETETDIYTSIESLPGINSANDKAGNLSIRGTDPDKTLIYFDNIPIYHQGHYFGAFSPFNPHVVESVKIQRNGSYGAEQGGRVGGAINIRSVSEVPDSAHYSAGIATTYFSGGAVIPVVKNKIGLMLGFRSSYPFHWNTPKINSVNNLVFQETEIGPALNGEGGFSNTEYKYAFSDMNGKLIYQINKKHTATASWMNIDNRFDINTVFSREKNQFFDSISMINHGVNIELKSAWSTNFKTNASFTQSTFNQSFNGVDLDSMDNNLGNELTNMNIKDSRFQVDARWQAHKNHALEGGYVLTQQDLISYMFDDSDSSLPTDIIENAGVHSVYANYDYFDLNKVIQFKLGGRLNYYDRSGKWYPEPRLQVNAFVHKHLTLKSSAGRYHQFINQLVGSRTSNIGGIDNFIWRLSDGEEIKVVKGDQGMIGAVFNKKNLLIDCEVFYKNIADITAFDFMKNDPNSFIYGGFQNAGIELLMKQKIKNLEGWISYSYTNSLARFDTAEFTYFRTQPHVLNIVTNYKFKKIKFSAGWNFKSGLPTTQIKPVGIPQHAGGLSPMNPGNGGPNGPPLPPDGGASVPEYIGFLPSNHQLDLSIVYSFMPKSAKWKGNIGLAIQNLYNNRVIVGQALRFSPFQPPQRINKYGLGFTPSIMVNVRW